MKTRDLLKLLAETLAIAGMGMVVILIIVSIIFTVFPI